MKIKRAREILGEKYSHLSDEQIKSLIDTGNTFSRLVLEWIEKRGLEIPCKKVNNENIEIKSSEDITHTSVQDDNSYSLRGEA